MKLFQMKNRATSDILNTINRFKYYQIFLISHKHPRTFKKVHTQ